MSRRAVAHSRMGAHVKRLAAVAASLARSPTDALVTAVCALLIAAAVRPLLRWALTDAVWSGSGNSACVGRDAACWVFVRERIGLFLFGAYPTDERWRVALVLSVMASGITVLLLPHVPGKPKIAALMLTVFPVSTAVLLAGGVLGLTPVPTSLWGGLSLTLVLASWGISTSMPLGIVLALARTSAMPMISYAAALYIEFWRGLPFIGVLFMAATMFPLFVPEGLEPDKLLRALVAFTLFNAAYMAEVFRGGLQAIGRGQYEAASSLSLPYWVTMHKIVLPQAFRIALPGLLNLSISIFKMTSVFLTIGLFEFLGMVQAGTADPVWLGSGKVLETGYLFAGLVYWIFCFGMSRYSRYVERSLSKGISP